MSDKYPPQLTCETAQAQVEALEKAWNTRDPDVVAMAYAKNCQWRNRDVVLEGREAIKTFLKAKWTRELHYRLYKSLWAYTGNRIAVRFEYEYQDAVSGQWYRAHGKEHWEVDVDGFISKCFVSANDIPIDPDERRIGAC